RQLAPFGQRSVCGERGRLDPRVLPGGDAEGVEVPLRPPDRLLEVGLARGRNDPVDEVHRAFLERPTRVTLVVAFDAPMARVGRVACDASRLQRARVDPRAMPVAVD